MHPFAFIGRYDGDGCAFQTFSAAAACTVQVVGRFFGNIQIDDMGNAFNIQTTGADIRRHQHVDAAFTETIHGIFSVHLTCLTVNTIGLDAVVAEFFHRYLNVFGVIQKYHSLGRFFPGDDFTQVQEFFSVGGKDVVMFDAFGYHAAAFCFQIDAVFLHHTNCFFFRFAANGSRQQYDLSVSQCGFDNSLYVFHVTVIHQSVPFVQNDGFHQMGLDLFLTNQIKDTTNGTHNDSGL